MIPDVARLGRFGQLTVHLAGIQIELHAIFVAWLLVLGLAAQRTGVSLAIWVVVAGVAVFVHELGHAAAYRAFGVTPRIVLSAVFGLTYGAELPLARSIVVSLAGSATGIVIGVAGLALQAALPAADGAVAVALADVVFVGLGWAVINLLPVLPLDGGQATRAAIRATGPGGRLTKEDVVNHLEAAKRGGGASSAGRPEQLQPMPQEREKPQAKTGAVPAI